MGDIPPLEEGMGFILLGIGQLAREFPGHGDHNWLKTGVFGHDLVDLIQGIPGFEIKT
jgi:hypothetical protein